MGGNCHFFFVPSHAKVKPQKMINKVMDKQSLSKKSPLPNLPYLLHISVPPYKGGLQYEERGSQNPQIILDHGANGFHG